MDFYINKKLCLYVLTMILILLQSKDGSILVDAGLILTSLGLVKVSKDEGKKFNYYAWCALFACFILTFSIKAFILN